MYAMCLKATDLGLGSLWIGDTDILRKKSKYKNLMGAIAIGYPAETPSMRPRKPIETISNLKPVAESDKIEDGFLNPDILNRDFIFFSYSHENTEIVLADIIEMKHHGMPLWYDKSLSVGEKWDESAISIIKKNNCIVFLLYISYESLKSENVLKEFLAAREEKKKIIPIVLGEVTIQELILKLRENGYCTNADIYEAFLGKNAERLYIGRSAFPRRMEHFEKLISICFESGISQEFAAYDQFFYQIKNSQCIITGYSGVGENLCIPNCISGYPVSEIAESAFAEKTFIKSVSFPNTLKCLGLGAFRHTGLCEVFLPCSVEEVKTACFRDCEDLKKAVFSPKITYLSEALFRGCRSLKRFEAPENIERIEEAAFRNCSDIEEIFLPDTLKSMTEGCFFGCKSLKRLVIPQTVIGAEIQSFDTSPLLERIQIGEFIFEKGKGCKV